MRRTTLLATLGLLPALCLAHGGAAEPMSGAHLRWSWDPLVLSLLALSGGWYALGLLRLWRRAGTGSGIRWWQAACFYGGWAVLFAALISPVDPLGEELFSAHMVQHELLMLVAAPLLVLGRPLAVFVWALPFEGRRAAGGATRAAALQAVWGRITHPLGAWTIHALVLWVWHAPPFFQAGIENVTVHTFQHFSFLAAALLFWWSLFNERQQAGIAVLSLLTTAIHAGTLGALLTFSSRLWYPVYAATTSAWGLTSLEDQQLGGLIMWIPGGLVYLFACLPLAARLLKAPPADLRPRTAMTER